MDFSPPSSMLDRRALMRTLAAAPSALGVLGATAAGAAPKAPAPVSGGLWTEYHAKLGKLSALLSHPDTPQDPMVIASGLTSFHRSSQLAWELAFEFNDHENPKVFPVSVRNLSHGWNASDAVYYVAIIDGARNYRLTGSRGAAPFVEIGVYDNLDGFSVAGEGGGRRFSSVNESDLGTPDSGKISVSIGPDEAPGPWLPTAPGEKVIFIRQYAFDWKETPSSFDFVVEPIEPSTSQVSYSEKLEKAFKRAPLFVENHTRIYHDIVTRHRRGGKNKIFHVPRTMVATLPKGHHYASGNFELKDDEILLVEFVPQEAPYWSFELGDFWGQTLDYDRTLDGLSNRPFDKPADQSHLNNRQIQLEKDGRVRLYISQGPRPKGARNWLDAKGHRIGFFVYRQFRQVERFPEFKTRVLAR